jgi:hypothetical protein
VLYGIALPMFSKKCLKTVRIFTSTGDRDKAPLNKQNKKSMKSPLTNYTKQNSNSGLAIPSDHFKTIINR